VEHHHRGFQARVLQIRVELRQVLRHHPALNTSVLADRLGA
jgi:hypothetical protein